MFLQSVLMKQHQQLTSLVNEQLVVDPELGALDGVQLEGIAPSCRDIEAASVPAAHWSCMTCCRQWAELYGCMGREHNWAMPLPSVYMLMHFSNAVGQPDQVVSTGRRGSHPDLAAKLPPKPLGRDHFWAWLMPDSNWPNVGTSEVTLGNVGACRGQACT